MKNANRASEVVFILDKDTEFLVSDLGFDYRLVCSGVEFEGLSESLPQFKYVVVLAELDWPENNLDIFYGFEIACRLRRVFRLNCPIIIVSSFKQSVFEALSRKNPEKFNIIYAAGTAFLHLIEMRKKILSGAFEKYLESLPAISDAVVEDMIEMLLQQKGFLIDRITHDLKFSLDSDDLKTTLAYIGSYLSNRQKELLNYADFSNKIIEAHQARDYGSFDSAKEELIRACSQHLGYGAHDTSVVPSEIVGKVLVVEDDPDQRRLIEEKLNRFFQLEITGSGREAIDILRKDTQNEIHAVIADWRLLKYDEKGRKTDYWQDYQGYQVLEAAARSHFAALISLTAEYDKNVHQIRNRLDIAIQLFKKQYIYATEGDAQWGMLVDIVREKCTKMAGLVSSIPTASNWRKYADQYREARLGVRWSSIEYNITQKADEYWDYFKDCLDPLSRPKVNKGLQDIMPLNTLENVLIGRRLFFALYYEFLRLRNDATVTHAPEQVIRVNGKDVGSPVLDAYAALRNNWWDTDVPDKEKEAKFMQYRQASKNLLNDLCIKSGEMDRMFPEEKSWLAMHGIDIRPQKVEFGLD
ncbi:MAG: response regulator [Methanobacteriota archaeon]|nr:MAG: response regulator [Euryarchaeota archaeon]